MSQRSQVSRIALWRCSLNVFVIVIVFVPVFVFVIVFLLVRSCLLIILTDGLNGDKSLGSLCCCVFKKVPHSVSEWVSDKVTYWAVGWTAKKMYNCLMAYRVCILESQFITLHCFFCSQWELLTPMSASCLRKIDLLILIWWLTIQLVKVQSI